MAKKTTRRAAAQSVRRERHEEDASPAFEGRLSQTDEVSSLTRAAKVEKDSERIFLASKLEMLRTHEGLDAASARRSRNSTSSNSQARQRRRARGTSRAKDQQVGEEESHSSWRRWLRDVLYVRFRSSFARGTSFFYEIVCPHQPGGNVNTWLYLTAMNRAQRGSRPSSRIRARTTPASRSSTGAPGSVADEHPLCQPLRLSARHRFPRWGLQVLLVWNSSYEISQNRWRNECSSTTASQTLGPDLSLRLRLDDGRADERSPVRDI